VKIGYSPSRKKYIILEVERWREGSGTVRALIRSRAERDGYMVQQTVPQDPGQAGKDQAQQIALSLSGWAFKAEPPTGDKGTRASSLAGQAEVGNVELLADGIIDGLPHWHQFFLDEMCGFPFWAHDDCLDAAASAFNRIFTRAGGLLDYYGQKLSDSERQQREAEERAAQTQGMGVISGQTADAGRAHGGGSTL
jgi:predicted phage terminase large subunit-like protein